MKRLSWLLALWMTISCGVSCSLCPSEAVSSANESEADSITLRITSVNDTLHIIYLNVYGQLRDSLIIPHPLYRFETGDLTGDGLPEVMIGVVKGSRYWPTPSRRIFIYHLFAGHYIRPLWLGSRVGHPLLDFDVCRDSVPCRIITTELPADSVPIHSQYRLQGFGLQFEKNINTFAL